MEGETQKIKFFWGAATSAYQVEGGNHNDWTEWEKARGLEQSGRACDHYNRFREDFDIAKSLGHNAHRFSIEWSRIEPEEGKFDEREIQHYRDVIDALRTRELEPFVTLWHFTNPIWFANKGGWANKKSPEYFARYVEKIVSALNPRRPTSSLDVGRLGVRYWITLNETNVYTGHGYWRGDWPPGKRSLLRYIVVNHRLSQAHAAAYRAIKKINPVAEVGVAHNMIYFTKFPVWPKNFIYNHFFLRSIKKFQDFVGVNYYFSDRATIDPDGFYHVLKDATCYKKPIYVTENGIADAEDEKRAMFIKDHIAVMHRAMSDGIDLRGYFYLSLLDNFEWDKGFAPRFGLVNVDYETQERTIRQSAYEYAKIIAR